MILGIHGLRQVRAKTNGKCAICGSTETLNCVGFIPAWTRVQDDIANQIPLCDKCYQSRRMQYIELGKLKYLSKEHVDELMLFYNNNAKYLKAYTRKFCKYRTMNLVSTEYALQVLSSYDTYIESTIKEKLE